MFSTPAQWQGTSRFLQQKGPTVQGNHGKTIRNSGRESDKHVHQSDGGLAGTQSGLTVDVGVSPGVQGTQGFFR